MVWSRWHAHEQPWHPSDLGLVTAHEHGSVCARAGSFTEPTPHSARTGKARLVEMAASSEVCVLCCPLNEHTLGIMDEEVRGGAPAPDVMAELVPSPAYVTLSCLRVCGGGRDGGLTD